MERKHFVCQTTKFLGEPQIIEHIMLLYNHRMCYTESKNVLKS